MIYWVFFHRWDFIKRLGPSLIRENSQGTRRDLRGEDLPERPHYYHKKKLSSDPGSEGGGGGGRGRGGGDWRDSRACESRTKPSRWGKICLESVQRGITLIHNSQCQMMFWSIKAKLIIVLFCVGGAVDSYTRTGVTRDSTEVQGRWRPRSQDSTGQVYDLAAFTLSLLTAVPIAFLWKFNILYLFFNDWVIKNTFLFTLFLGMNLRREN